jgi:hypothetical protein
MLIVKSVEGNGDQGLLNQWRENNGDQGFGENNGNQGFGKYKL